MANNISGDDLATELGIRGHGMYYPYEKQTKIIKMLSTGYPSTRKISNKTICNCVYQSETEYDLYTPLKF